MGSIEWSGGVYKYRLTKASEGSERLSEELAYTLECKFDGQSDQCYVDLVHLSSNSHKAARSIADGVIATWQK